MFKREEVQSLNEKYYTNLSSSLLSPSLYFFSDCITLFSEWHREFQRLQKSVHDVLARRSLLGTAVEEEHVHSGTSSLSQSGYTLLRERSTAHESAQLLSEVREFVVVSLTVLNHSSLDRIHYS